MENRIPEFTAEALAASTLARRADAQSFLDDAAKHGRKREAKQWETLIRRMDKTIDKYGLRQYA